MMSILKVLSKLSSFFDQVNCCNMTKICSYFSPLVYQGEHDTQMKLTNDEFQKMIDFTKNLFIPTHLAQIESVRTRVSPNLMAISSPVISAGDLDKVLADDDSDAKQVLKRINAWKVLRNDDSPDSFTSEVVDGYIVKLERGNLGLVRV